MARLKLHIPVDICYGSLSFFIAILQNVFLLYHVDIFVSVYKIDKMSFWIGETIFLIWNSFNDPLFGWLSDKKYLSSSPSRKSAPEIILQRISSLRFNGPLFSLSFLVFWVSWGLPSLQFVICLCLYDGFLTLIDLHHSALLADLVVSAEERTKLNSRCSLFSALGSASVFMSYLFWDKENLFLFKIFCVILSAISVVGFHVGADLLQTFYRQSQKTSEVTSYQECDFEDDKGSQDKTLLKKFVKDLTSHKNFIWFAVMNLIQVFHCHFNSNFFPLFLENLLGDAITPGFGSFLIGVSFVAPHINNLYFLTLCRRFGVYRVIKILFMVKLALSVFMFFMGYQYVWLLCVFIASNRVFTEGTCKLLNLVISDLVDEDFVLHKRQQAVSALIFGTSALLSKPGQTLAPLIGTWVLAYRTGHDIFQSGSHGGSIKADMQSMSLKEQMKHRQGCFDILVYIPIICAILQLLAWAQFTLHGRRLSWVKSVRAGSQSTSI